MKAALSIAFEDLRGKAGTVVVSKSRSGLVIRNRVSGKNPRTAAQQAIRVDFAKAAAAYKNLTSTQVANWKNYAQTVTKTNPVSGDTYHPAANAVFSGLAIKFLQVSPSGTIPTSPPAGPFAGDTITVTTTASTGKVTFTASGANQLGVKTELLLQKLASANRTPQPDAYRTKAFVSFVAGTLSFDVVVPPGYYAAAYRFVSLATGQTTNLQPLTTQQVTFAVSEGHSKAA